MTYEHIKPFYEYPHTQNKPCDCLDCKEMSLINAIEIARKNRPSGTIKVRLIYKGRSKPLP